MRWNFDSDKPEAVETSQLKLVLDLAGIGVKPGLQAKLELAAATASISDVACTKSREPQSVDIDLQTRAGELELTLFNRTVLTLDLSDAKSTRLRFNAAEIRNGTMKTGRTGLGVNANQAPLLYRPLVSKVDETLVALGLNVGEADVRVSGVNCTRPYLVQ